MMRPLISVVIPVYNVAPYLRECLDSVLAQTFTDWEAICVDDGSTDASGAILDDYAAKDARFKVIHQENAGVSVARNAGLEKARGDNILFLDGDDLIPPNYLEAHVSTRRNLPSDAVTYAGYLSLYVDGCVCPYQIREMRDYDSIADFLASMMSGPWSTIISGWLWPRSVLSQGGAWANDIVSHDDLEFSFRQLTHGCCAAHFVPDARAVYRKHPNGLSHLKHDDAYFASIFKVAERRGEYALSVEDSARMRGAVAQWWYSLLFSKETWYDRRRRDFVLHHLKRLGMPACTILGDCPRQNAFLRLFGLHALLLVLRVRERLRGLLCKGLAR